MRSASAASTQSPVKSSSLVFFCPSTNGISSDDGARAVADLGLAEARVVGRDDHVAGHRELAGAGQAPAAHRGDRRPRQRPQLHAERDVGREQLVPALGARDLALDLLGDVEAGGERAPGAGQHDDLHLIVDGGPAQARAQPLDELAPRAH